MVVALLMQESAAQDSALALAVGYWVVGSIVTVAVFLVLRGLLLWYWKLNRIDGHLAGIYDLLLRADAAREGRPMRTEAPTWDSKGKRRLFSKR